MKIRLFVFGILLFFVFSGDLCAQKVNTRPSKWAQSVKSSNFDNLFTLNDSIYRSEQPDSLGFIEIADCKIKSILNLRRGHDDRNVMGKVKFKLYHVDMEPDLFSDYEIIEALKIILKAPKPLLVHCAAGSDRTGVVIAMYRIVFENWSKDEAIKELTDGGYNFHDDYTNIPIYIQRADIGYIKKQIQL